MRNPIIFLLISVSLNLYCQDQNSFIDHYLQIIKSNDSSAFENYLIQSQSEIDQYIKNTSESSNLLTLLYRNNRMNLSTILIKNYPELLTLSIPTTSTVEPPTIFIAVSDDNLSAVESIIRLGFPINRYWFGPARYPYNLYSIAKSDNMKQLLLQYGVSTQILINNWPIITFRDNINIYAEPNASSTVIAQVNNGLNGHISKAIATPEKLNGKNIYWLYVIFDNSISGWTQSNSYIIPNLLGG
jgi:hypothetical protein